MHDSKGWHCCLSVICMAVVVTEASQASAGSGDDAGVFQGSQDDECTVSARGVKSRLCQGSTRVSAAKMHAGKYQLPTGCCSMCCILAPATQAWHFLAGLSPIVTSAEPVPCLPPKQHCRWSTQLSLTAASNQLSSCQSRAPSRMTAPHSLAAGRTRCADRNV